MGDPQEWTTGGDRICRMKWIRETYSIAVGVVPKIEECGAPATVPINYKGDPHLVCVECADELLDKLGAEEIGM
jgi:hypothetical protein